MSVSHRIISIISRRRRRRRKNAHKKTNVPEENVGWVRIEEEEETLIPKMFVTCQVKKRRAAAVACMNNEYDLCFITIN